MLSLKLKAPDPQQWQVILVVISLILLCLLAYFIYEVISVKNEASAKISRLNEIAAGQQGVLEEKDAKLAALRDELAKAKESLAKANALKESAIEQFQEIVWEQDIARATVGKGEGIEHALIRQLVNDPESLGFEGDVNDQKAVKKWAQREAHNIAIRAGYVAGGKEIRVGKANQVAYVLTGNQVTEYLRGEDGNFPNAPGQINPLVEKIELAQLDEAQSYEYVATLRI